MSYAPKVSVQTQLTLAILLALFVSYLISSAAMYYLMRRDMQEFRQQVRTAQSGDDRHFPPDPGLVEFLIGPFGHHQPSADHERQPATPAAPRPASPPPDHRISDSVMAISRPVIALLLAFGIGAWLSRHFTQPLAVLASGARAFHGGDFTHRVPITGSNEFAEVATAMNDMAARMAAQLQTLEDDAVRRQQLLADVAHELRGPITTLRTMSGALDDGVAEDPVRRARAVQLMSMTTDRLHHLITDLLELAKLDLHELPLHPQAVDVREIAEYVQQSHQAAATQAGLLLQEVAPGDPLVLTVDPNRFAQVLDNLLDNAISYAGAGATVAIALTQDAQSTRVVIHDTGQGIPAPHLPFIFDPFYRADKARSPKDNHSGLGLRIARGLIVAQGGTLEIVSVEGAGTDAVITFPRA